MIRDIGFDADDTLWHTENMFQETQRRLAAILVRYAPHHDVQRRLHETELRNVRLFGYGIKGFTLSMVETAIEISGGRIAAADIHEIVMMGKAMLDSPLEIMPAAKEVLEALQRRHRLFLITKGDLLDQTNKIDKSGLGDFFDGTEIVNAKTAESYTEILRRHNIAPSSFLMVGNSVPSDIAPVLEIGGWAVHVPYEYTAVYEMHDIDPDSPRFRRIESLIELPGVVAQIVEAA